MNHATLLPKEPGVYIFKDRFENIIYIGKAKNLRRRVSSYFSKAHSSVKTTFLVKNIHSIEHIIVQNEVEALLLENKLIKKHNPKYNIMLKDAKTYAYICISDHEFPRLYSTRSTKAKGTYFGPYTDGAARAQVVRLCNELFKLRTCRSLPKRACLQYHIGLCSAPCIDKSAASPKEYAKQVEQATEFLRGDTKPILEQLNKEMREASDKLAFEVAREKKRQIDAITILHEKQHVDLIKRFDQDVIAWARGKRHTAICLFSISKGVISGKKEFIFEHDESLIESFCKMYYSRHYIPSEIIVAEAFWNAPGESSGSKEESKYILESYFSRIKGGAARLTHARRGEKRRLVELAMKNAEFKLENKILKELQQKLHLPELPRIIECFDMSNLGHEHLVGAMVQYVNGQPNKNAYRRFEIKEHRGMQDDFASMYEVVLRRYTRLLREEKKLPDLIIVDGGKGQLSAALDALVQAGVKIPIIGLAKREEEIYLPHENKPRAFAKNSAMMRFVRQVRDEVHRFVLAYNRKKREMKLREEIRRVEERKVEEKKRMK